MICVLVPYIFNLGYSVQNFRPHVMMYRVIILLGVIILLFLQTYLIMFGIAHISHQCAS